MSNPQVHPVKSSEPLLLTVKQAATRLQLGTNRVYELTHAANKPIPSIRIGNTIRIPATALERWIADNTRC